MINNIDTSQMQHIPGKPPFQQPDPAKTPSVDNAEVSIQLGFDSLVQQTMEISEAKADADAVQEARRLLQSGRLDTPQNVRAAAEDILKFGI